jgi:hypothetical protein
VEGHLGFDGFNRRGDGNGWLTHGNHRFGEDARLSLKLGESFLVGLVRIPRDLGLYHLGKNNVVTVRHGASPVRAQPSTITEESSVLLTVNMFFHGQQ